MTKFSSVELLMNNTLIFIFIFQIILCIISAISRGYYYHLNNLDYVDGGGDIEKISEVSFGYTMHGFILENFLNVLTYLLLLNTMIPISLINFRISEINSRSFYEKRCL